MRAARPRSSAALVLLVVLLWATCVHAAAPVFDTAGQTTALSATSISNSMTVANVADRIMLAVVQLDATLTVTSATCGGSAMTFVTAFNDGGTGNERLEFWRFLAPVPGAGNSNVALTFSGTSGFTNLVILAYNGVDQTTPLGTPVTNPGTNATPTVTVSSATGETVFSAMFDLGTGQTPTGGQTDRISAVIVGTTLTGAEHAGAASVTPSYSGGGAIRWAELAVALKPVGAPPSNKVRHRSQTY